MTEHEKTLEWISKNITLLQKGTRVRIDHRYTSVVVDIIDDEGEEVVVYKDWDKYRKIWEYHCTELMNFMYTVGLYVKMYHGKFGEGNER